MRTRPNMKMLACLGTYFALLAYEVAFDKHCAAFQLARASSSAGLFKSTSSEIDGENEKEERGENNGIGTRMNVGKRRMKQVANVRFPVFPPSLLASLSLSLSPSLLAVLMLSWWNSLYLRKMERWTKLDEGDYFKSERRSWMSHFTFATRTEDEIFLKTTKLRLCAIGLFRTVDEFKTRNGLSEWIGAKDTVTRGARSELGTNFCLNNALNFICWSEQ